MLLCERGCGMERQKRKKRRSSIRGKLLRGYLILVVIILVLGILGVNSIYQVYSNGNTIYYNHLRSVEYLKSVSQNIREIDRDLIILCTQSGMQDDSEYMFDIMTIQNENDRLLHAYEKLALTEMERRRYKQCRLSLLSFNRQVNSILTLIEKEEYEPVTSVYEEELAPIKAVAFELIDAAVDLSARRAEERNIANQEIFSQIIIAACVLCLCSVGTAVAIAYVMSNYFTRRFETIRQLARRMGEYDISDDIKELPEDELGDTMRALNDSQFMMRDFIGKTIGEMDEMTDMGKDVAKAVRRVRDQLQAESVRLAGNEKCGNALKELMQSSMKGEIADHEREEQAHRCAELSDSLRSCTEKTCSALAELTSYLEQIAVTAEQQNEILTSHRDKISRFKTGSE